MKALTPKALHIKKDAKGEKILSVMEFENSSKVIVSYKTGKEYMCSYAKARELWKNAK